MSRSSFTLSIALVLLVALSGIAAPAPQGGKPNVRVPATLKEKAPDICRARFDTSAGAFVIEVHRDWAPNGADRFYNLVKNGFFDGARFFRVMKGFMVQFGLNGNPTIQSAWNTATIADDTVKQSNKRGFVTFAKTAAPNSRTTQVFINFGNNASLDADGFAPFGQVVSGMDVVDKLYSGYGDGPPRGTGPDQTLIRAQGNRYLTKEFPKLDYVKAATIEK